LHPEEDVTMRADAAIQALPRARTNPDRLAVVCVMRVTCT
jgi:hypothetical protein